jgi:hypothetical protein
VTATGNQIIWVMKYESRIIINTEAYARSISSDNYTPVHQHSLYNGTDSALFSDTYNLFSTTKKGF